MTSKSKRFLAYTVLGVAFHGLVYSGLAFLSSRRDRRRGWQRGRPGRANCLGLGLVGTGAAVIAGAAAGHHAAAPEGARPTARPEYLAQGGAYQWTRNPLYLGGMTMWFGWAIFLGSRRAATIAAAWLAGLHFIGVPYEERTLTATFGDSYRDYQQRVPRWL